jgi:hypothetical protein
VKQPLIIDATTEYSDSRARRPSDEESALCKAMIAQELEDFLMPEYPQDRIASEQWLFDVGGSPDRHFSIAWCCNRLDIKVESLCAALRDEAKAKRIIEVIDSTRKLSESARANTIAGILRMICKEADGDKVKKDPGS